MTREEAKKILRKLLAEDEDIDFFSYDEKKAVEYFISLSENKGEWIYTPEKVLDDETDEGRIYIIKSRRTCSNCGGDYGFGKPDKESFCKFCGADMRGDKE